MTLVVSPIVCEFLEGLDCRFHVESLDQLRFAAEQILKSLYKLVEMEKTVGLIPARPFKVVVTPPKVWVVRSKHLTSCEPYAISMQLTLRGC